MSAIVLASLIAPVPIIASTSPNGTSTTSVRSSKSTPPPAPIRSAAR
jgi:hypothetical protein